MEGGNYPGVLLINIQQNVLSFDKLDLRKMQPSQKINGTDLFLIRSRYYKIAKIFTCSNHSIIPIEAPLSSKLFKTKIMGNMGKISLHKNYHSLCTQFW